MTASATPTVTAAISAAKVMRNVISNASESVPQSLIKVCTINSGPGRM